MYLTLTKTTDDAMKKPEIDPRRPVPYEADIEDTRQTKEKDTAPPWRVRRQYPLDQDTEEVQDSRDECQRQEEGTASHQHSSQNQNRPWHRRGCAIFSDPTICVCGLFCLPCMICVNAEALNLRGPVFSLLSCCLPCWPTYKLRKWARSKYNIQGSDNQDILMSTCCTQITNCQIAHEIQKHGD